MPVRGEGGGGGGELSPLSGLIWEIVKIQFNICQ